MFENAKWICRRLDQEPEKYKFFPNPYFIRDISLKGKVRKAVLYVCGLGQAAYYIDGERIPDSFRPTHPSEYRKTMIYNTFDITQQLREGNHRFGAVVGNYRLPIIEKKDNIGDLPRLIAQIELEYADGTKESIVSDESFLTAPSPITFTCDLYGEHYDARLEIQDWCLYGAALSYFRPSDITEGFGGQFRSTGCPPIRITEELPGVEIKPGIFDFGKITAGHVRMTITGKRGAVIKLVHGEFLTRDGRHAQITAYTPGPYPDLYNSDVYILDGEPNKTFEQVMAFHGFRYVEVIGEYENISLTAYTSHTDLPETSRFECNNPILNRIHQACVRSMLTCYQGMPLDNPKRDAPWIGDIMLDCENYAQNFDSYDTLYEYCLSLIDSQHEDGFFPWMAPRNSQNVYNRGRFIGPDWGDSGLLHIVYYVYKYTGNPEIVKTAYPHLVKLIEYFDSLAVDGLIPSTIQGTGDWSGLKGFKEADISVMSNAYYYWDLKMMAELAEELHLDNSEYKKKAESVRTAFRNKYVKDGKLTLTHISERIVSCYVGFLEEEEKKQTVDLIAEEIIQNDYAFTFGMHGIRMVAPLLSEYGYADVIYYTLVNEEPLGYAHDIKEGMATLPERFDALQVPERIFSLNHHFSSTIDTWFFSYLAGIKIHGFGYQHVEIKPTFVKGVHTLSAEMHKIKVFYDRNTITVQSPYDFTLTLQGKSVKYHAGRITVKR